MKKISPLLEKRNIEGVVFDGGEQKSYEPNLLRMKRELVIMRIRTGLNLECHGQTWNCVCTSFWQCCNWVLVVLSPSLLSHVSVFLRVLLQTLRV